MTASRYMVVRRVNDDNVVSAIMGASESQDLRDANKLKEHLQRVTRDTDLVKIVRVDIETTPHDALERAWRNSVAYPIQPDGTISFDNAYFPLQSNLNNL